MDLLDVLLIAVSLMAVRKGTFVFFLGSLSCISLHAAFSVLFCVLS